MPQEVVVRGVSMYPEDWAIVLQVAKDTGQRSLSGGLRFIVTDWARRVRREATDDGNGVRREGDDQLP